MQTNSEYTNDIPEEDLIALHTIYYNEPITFCEQILNVEPDDQQRYIIESLQNDKIVTVRSGRGCGKTWTCSMIVWWFVCTRYFAQVYATAPTASTISSGLWPTIAKINANMNPLYKDQFELQTTMIKHKEHPLNWFCMSRTSRAENPDAMGGGHAGDMLFIIDESSGLSQDSFDVIFGSLTEENNYLLMVSNPRRLNGPFWMSHRPHSAKIFKQIQMNALKSKWVTEASIKKWEILYGKDSNAYKIEVLGDFPEKEDDAIISLADVMAAVERNKERHFEQNEEVNEADMVWGLDIGGGKDPSVLVKRKGIKIYNDIRVYNDRDTMRVIGKVKKHYDELKEEDRPKKIAVDNVAIGHAAFFRMKELKLPVVGAHASGKSRKKKYNFSAKADWWCDMRDFFRDDDVLMCENYDLMEELSTVREKIMSTGKFHVESKEEYKKRNKRSPNHADALAMTFTRKNSVVTDQDSILFL